MATAKWEHLTCKFEPKPHKWKRELGKRGRKPEFCEKHKPVKTVATSSGEPKELYCEIGKHKWLREPTRGRVPTSCPEHKAAPIIQSAPRTESGKVELHCEIGNHTWERAPSRGRKPRNCPDHSAAPPRSVPVSIIAGSESGDTVPKKATKTPEQITEEKAEKSRERAANLEGRLKERGTHISQQEPYFLYKKVKETPARNKKDPPTIEWEKVAEHEPLAMAQYVNKHEADFVNGLYRYVKDNKVINIL